MIEMISGPWPWYVAGPLIGLMVPLLLFIGNKSFGISSNLKHICAACIPANIPFFSYNWKSEVWGLFMITGVVIGAFLADFAMTNYEAITLNPKTIADLELLGITDFSGIAPVEIFNWENVLTAQGLIMIIFGGFLVGFGTRYANGCTSGHAITGMSNLQLSSLVAVIGFFIGGLLMTHVFYPIIF